MLKRCLSAAFLAAFIGTASYAAPAVAGTWSKVTATAPVSTIGNVALLTDGSVLVNADNGTSFYKLTPDLTGSYANGTWTQVASNHFPRRFTPSAMLKDGRYLIAGGEFVTGTTNSNVEIYDPVADTWTLGPDMPALIGDTATSILADGRFYSSSKAGPNTFIYDPGANVWTASDPIGTGVSGDEKGWTLLQDGTVLDAFNVASRFNPSTGHWVPTGPLPTFPDNKGLVSALGSEIGPMSLLYSGKVLQLGAACATMTNGTCSSVAPDIGHSAIYDPTTNTWTAGTDAPDGLQWGDSSAAVMTNGRVLCSTTPFVAAGAVSAIWEYDPTVVGPQAFVKVADGTDAFAHNSPVPLLMPFMLQLPNGQVLAAQGVLPTQPSPNFYLYSPTPVNGTPAASWRPSITSIAALGSGEFTLSGTQLNGLTNGASFGDDANMATNYPIVSLEGAGQKYYARTHNFAQMAPRPGFNSTCQFTLPTNIPTGSYLVRVSANGIENNSANAKPITIPLHVASIAGTVTGQTPGSGVSWFVNLSGPALAPGGITVNLQSSAPSVATVPSSVFIPGGSTSASFTVMANGFGSATISAIWNGNGLFKAATKKFGWSVNALSGPDVPPDGSPVQWTVFISNAAPLFGLRMNISVGDANGAATPSSFVIPSGATTGTFTVSRGSWIGGSSTITAFLIGSDKTMPITTFNPALLSAFLPLF